MTGCKSVGLLSQFDKPGNHIETTGMRWSEQLCFRVQVASVAIEGCTWDIIQKKLIFGRSLWL